MLGRATDFEIEPNRVIGLDFVTILKGKECLWLICIHT